MNRNEKAVAQLEGMDIQAKVENDTVYACIGDTELELSEYEINYQAKVFDEEASERLSHLICEDEDRYEDMEGALKLLEAQSEIDGSVMADDIVMMWQKVEHSFTVDELLEEIRL